jgi:hypothetical protein
MEMRTHAEIAERVRELAADRYSDFFGVHISRLIEALPFSYATEHLSDILRDGVEPWEVVPATREAQLAEARAYMPFAWGKMVDERGISAGRSIDHFRGIAWLMGDDDMVAFLNDDSNYPHYGRPMLERLCEAYDLPRKAVA